MLQREIEPTPTQKTDAAAAFLASLEEPKLTSLADAGKKPPIEILPPGMMSLNAPISIQKKPASAAQTSQQPAGKPLAIEAPPTTTAAPESATPQPESGPAPASDPLKSESASDSTPVPAATPPQPESGETTAENGDPTTTKPGSDENPNVNGENPTVQAEPTTGPAPPEVPSPAAEVTETNAPSPTTVPVSEPLV